MMSVEEKELSLKLKEAEGVEILSLMDNTVDILSTIHRSEVRSVREWTKKHFLPIAEHGFSLLVRIFNGNGFHSVLFDAGISPNEVVINARKMGVNLAEIECIVLSHGHYDHFGGLPAVVRSVKKNNLPIIVHEHVFRTRAILSQNGTIRKLPALPTEEKVKPAKYVKTTKPYLIADNLILITGEIPRKTSFEKGFPSHKAFLDGKWQPDPLIWDDRALIINLKHKGLIVLSGCAHAGIINTVLYAKQLTGIEAVYAILGGFHLAGKEHEAHINQTVKELKKINPKIVAPSHCTGWQGRCAISKALPKAFVWNNVGNLYKFN